MLCRSWVNSAQATSFYECEEGITHEVVGHCEMTELPIFEHDEFSHDEEGVMWLNDVEGRLD